MFSFLKSPPDRQLLVQANTAFALNLYHKLSQGQEGNLFFSPFSLSVALAMTWAGARSDTARQMRQVLHFDLPPERLHAAFAGLLSHLEEIQKQGAVTLLNANALWPKDDYPFLAEFIRACEQYYGVSIRALDFNQSETSRQVINGWVSEQTAGKINELIPGGILNSLTRLVLTNAVYFKGNWLHQFDQAHTRIGPFYCGTGEVVQVPLMRLSDDFGYARYPDLQVLELPYQGEELSLIVLLPKEKDGLQALEARLKPENLRKWTGTLHQEEVDVFLPSFRSEGAYNLNDPLIELGMPDAFDDDRADFSGMDGIPHWLVIKAVLHKAFVEVNEQGSEAAAATAVVATPRARPQPQPKPIFRADHPFLFLIQERSSGTILFLGRLVNP